MVDVIKKKLIPTVIIFVLVLSSCCLVVFADGDESIVSDDFRQWTLDTSISSTTPVVTFSNGHNSIRLPNPSGSVYAAYYSIPSFVANHEFTLTFNYYGNFQAVNCAITLFNDDTSSDEFHELGEITSNIGQSNVQTFSITFNPSNYFTDISNLKLYFEFYGGGSSTNYTLHIIDLSLVDNTGSSSQGLASAITDYIQPSLNWFMYYISSFFTLIESQWYYLFAWYVFNSAFIIVFVVYSVFDWIDLFSEGITTSVLNKRYEKKKKALIDDIREYKVKQAQTRYASLSNNKSSSEFPSEAVNFEFFNLVSKYAKGRFDMKEWTSSYTYNPKFDYRKFASNINSSIELLERAERSKKNKKIDIQKDDDDN